MRTFELVQDLDVAPAAYANVKIDGIPNDSITKVEFVYDANVREPAVLKITFLAFDGTDTVTDTETFEIGKARVSMEIGGQLDT